MGRNPWILDVLLIIARAVGNSQTPVCPGFVGGAVDDHYSVENAAKARRFLADLKAAVHEENKKKMGSMILYPLSVAMGSGEKELEIRNSDQFLLAYRTVISPRIRKVLESQDPECLFANREGIMVGRGEVWFRLQSDGKFKIISIIAN